MALTNMALTGKRTFVGFGFGPIQAGLFILEAVRSENFGRIVVGEVLPELVQAIRENGGRFAINVRFPVSATLVARLVKSLFR